MGYWMRTWISCPHVEYLPYMYGLLVVLSQSHNQAQHTPHTYMGYWVQKLFNANLDLIIFLSAELKEMLKH
jgi:hypothetical protein